MVSRDDAFGIALVWLLFESGLRGDPIARILNDMARSKKANANFAAKKLLASGCEYLVVVRQPRRPARTPAEKPAQETQIVSRPEAQKPRAWNSGAVELLIPVGEKFRDIEKRIDLLFGG